MKELILETRNRKVEIENEISKAGWQLFWSRVKYILVLLVLVGLVISSIRRKRVAAIEEAKQDIAVLYENLRNTKVAINFDMESEVAAPFERFERAFDAMCKAAALWTIATQQAIDRVKARSWAGTVLSRAPVRFWRGGAELVETKNLPLALGTQERQNTIYFYPGFVLVIGPRDFALVDLIDVRTMFENSRFQEIGAVPADGKILGYSWAKSNKDGSRDRRFSANKQIPILHYGTFYLQSGSGLNAAYMTSRAESCAEFVLALEHLKRVLSRV